MYANTRTCPIVPSAHPPGSISITPALHPALLLPCPAIPATIIRHPLQWLAKIPAKGHGHLPAVPPVVERCIGLLEIDIPLHLVRIQEVPDRELQAGLILHHLFGDGDRP